MLRKEVDNLSLDDYDEYCHDDYVCPTCNFENWACEPIRLDRTEDQLQKLRSRSELVTYLGDPLSITTKEQLTGNILVIGEPDGILIPKSVLHHSKPFLDVFLLIFRLLELPRSSLDMMRNMILMIIIIFGVFM